MRIVAGEFRSRRLRPPGAPARATPGRVREAWFSILGARVIGADVVDLFAGSGALGLEALSRGARRVTFVERARQSSIALEQNVTALDVRDRVDIQRVDVFKYLAATGSSFDIAFADPPFDSDAAVELVRVFRKEPFADILGVEHRSQTALPGADQRRYGDVSLTFFYAE